ncbi:DNA-polymerase [Sesbania bispinosa]|nr:DNA-polymerase [Sesbania bispinosa]
MERWKKVMFSEEEEIEIIVPKDACVKESDAWFMGRLATQDTDNLPYGPLLRALPNRSNGVFGGRQDDTLSNDKRNTKNYVELVEASQSNVARLDNATEDNAEKSNPDVNKVLESFTKCQLHNVKVIDSIVLNDDEERSDGNPEPCGKADQNKECVGDLQGGTQSVNEANDENQITSGACITNPTIGKGWKRRARS